MIKVGKCTIGSGMPKICVPIIEKEEYRILEKAKELIEEPIDIIEWRADFFENVFEKAKVKDLLQELQNILQDIPLLVTFRTKAEGGEREITPEQYQDFILSAIEDDLADLIDVEMYRGEEGNGAGTGLFIKKLMDQIGTKAVVVGSYHDFEKTPPLEEIVERLLFMDRLGAGIPKIAVMPKTQEDVLTLIGGTVAAKKQIGDKPLITMSMGGIGTISRLSGETFGSAVTFGRVGEASAPGQVAVNQLHQVLEIIHQAQ